MQRSMYERLHWVVFVWLLRIPDCRVDPAYCFHVDVRADGHYGVSRLMDRTKFDTGYQDGWDAHRNALKHDAKIANEMGTQNSLFRQMNPRGCPTYRKDWFDGWLASRRQAMGF